MVQERRPDMTLAGVAAAQVLSGQMAQGLLVVLAARAYPTRFAQVLPSHTVVAVAEAALVQPVSEAREAGVLDLPQPQELPELRTQVVAGALAEHPVGPAALAAAASLSYAASLQHP